jgi:bla regulator protein blaR1
MTGRLAVAALATVSVWGQARFEVATVKPVDTSKLGDTININLGTVRHEEVTFGNAALMNCIRFAYNLTSDAQIIGPDWIKSNQYIYDVDAKGAPGASREQLQAMMQTLLQERFKLVIHRDQKEMSHYALVPVKGGARIRAIKEVPADFRGTTLGGRINSILQMPMLAYLLSRFERERPIIDQTGLSGFYEVKLEWTPAQQLQKDDPAPGPSLFTAVEEQLGLKLEARKGPVEILVVDSAEKVPTEN